MPANFPPGNDLGRFHDDKGLATIVSSQFKRRVRHAFSTQLNCDNMHGLFKTEAAMARKAKSKASAKRKASAAKTKPRIRKAANQASKAASRKRAARKTTARATKRTKVTSRSAGAKTPPNASRVARKKAQAKKAPSSRIAAPKAVGKASSSSKPRTAAASSKPITSSITAPQEIKAVEQEKVSHPGMMGDGTEEQNLNEQDTPEVRITKEEVDAAFKSSDSDKS
jgi:hypothetical protein